MKSPFHPYCIFGDHAVLQRSRPIRISGVAYPDVMVYGTLADQHAVAVTDNDGKWVLEFAPMEAGGPYELTLTTEHWSRTYRDVLIGDVWFCSGQSNMEFPVCGARFFSLPDGEKIADEASDNHLRLFLVPRAISPDAECDENPFAPQWRAADEREAVATFSAVAYLFGLELRRRLGDGIPIGLIDSSWGGTFIEAWTPLAALEEADIDETLADYRGCVAASRDGKQNADEDAFGGEQYTEWICEKFRKTDPKRTAEALEEWPKPENESVEWRRCERPPITYLADVGTYWLRCHVTLPQGVAGHRAVLHIDNVDDCDIAWVDGEKVGATEPFHNNYWIEPRDYAFTVRETPGGTHTVVVRIENHFNVGTFRGRIGIVLDNGTFFSLEDLGWEVRTEFIAPLHKIGTRPDPGLAAAFKFSTQHMATTLYNAMVRPSTEMNIKGAIWYQGCNNAFAWDKYGALQKALIDGWRKAWRDPAMPFIITQLAGYMTHTPEARHDDSEFDTPLPLEATGFAPIRAVQQEFLDYPETGVACTFDAGDAWDIHPPDKRTVAVRLAHEAMRIAYGNALATPGPHATRAHINGNAIEVDVADCGEGLAIDDGGPVGPRLFGLVGENGKTAWTTATIIGGQTLRVAVPDGFGPVAEVLYCYSAFALGPYVRRKGDGLPLFPFRYRIRS